MLLSVPLKVLYVSFFLLLLSRLGVQDKQLVSYYQNKTGSKQDTREQKTKIKQKLKTQKMQQGHDKLWNQKPESLRNEGHNS